MKRSLAVLLVFMLLVTGCGKAKQGSTGSAEDIKIDSEKIVKEFTGTINIYNKVKDVLMLTAENGDSFENYNVDIKTGQVSQDSGGQAGDQYVYFEQVADKGYLYVEGEGSENVLKFKAKSGEEKIIASNIGFSDGINMSISPDGSKIAYTAVKAGTQEYGLYIQDLSSPENHILFDKVDEGFITSFSYMVNWSGDNKYVIIQDKYIFDAVSGSRKGELASTYTQWSPGSSKIAFILEDDAGRWINANDAQVYPGKKVCIYDMKSGDYKELFSIPGDEYVFGDLSWSKDEKKLAFTGIKVKDTSAQDWYTKLNYSTVYIVDTDSGKSVKMSTNVDASDGSGIELTNLVFSGSGNLLSYTVGNFEKSDLHVFDTKTMESKVFDNAEYLHWINNEGYVVQAGSKGFYFCINNSIVRLDEKLEQTVKYTSKTNLDDFYTSDDGSSMIILENEGEGSIIRYLGK